MESATAVANSFITWNFYPIFWQNSQHSEMLEHIMYFWSISHKNRSWLKNYDNILRFGVDHPTESKNIGKNFKVGLQNFKVFLNTFYEIKISRKFARSSDKLPTLTIWQHDQGRRKRGRGPH